MMVVLRTGAVTVGRATETVTVPAGAAGVTSTTGKKLRQPSSDSFTVAESFAHGDS